MKSKFPSKKLIDKGKNVLICLLLVSAVFLMFKAVVFEPGSVFGRLSAIFGAETGSSTGTYVKNDSLANAAEPMYILITTEDGSHYASKYDNTNKTKLFSQFSSELGEALGSSDEAVKITENEWHNSLKKTGVFFDYLYAQPLSAIATFLGTEVNADFSSYTSRRIFLGGSENDSLYLYFINEADNYFYRCATALSFSALSSAISELPIGNSHFAFEMGEEYEKLDPYFIFSEENSQIRAVSASNPLKDFQSGTALLEIFNMNSRTTSELPEDGKSKVYVDGSKSLRIDASGKVVFSVVGVSGLEIPIKRNELTIDDCISAAFSIVQSTVGVVSGEGSLDLADISGLSSPNSCILNFSYSVAGIPVSLPGSAYAVSVQISGGSIVRVEMQFRQYSYTGEYLYPMPEKMVTAIAKQDGGEPILMYNDSISTVTCSWKTN